METAIWAYMGFYILIITWQGRDPFDASPSLAAGGSFGGAGVV